MKGFKLIQILLTSMLILILITPANAQIEDDFPENPEETDVNCIPENLETPYDVYYNPETPENDIRKWYSFGSEYYKVQNYKDALPYLWKVFINDSGKYAVLAIRKITYAYFQARKSRQHADCGI